MKLRKILISLRPLLALLLPLGAVQMVLTVCTWQDVALALRWGREAPAALGLAGVLLGLALSVPVETLFSLLGGRMAHYHVVELSFAGLGLHRRADGRLHPGFRRTTNRLVPLLMAPATPHDTETFLLPVAGGPLGLLIVAAALASASLLLRMRMAAFWLALGCGACLVRLALMLLPRRDGNDLPFYLGRLWTRPDARRARAQYLCYLDAFLTGTHPLDMPDSCFECHQEDLFGFVPAYAVTANTAQRLLMQDDYSGALAAADALLRYPDAPLPYYPGHLRCIAALAELADGKEPHHALLLQEPAVEVFAGGYPGLYLCARFGHALLVDHDPNALRWLAALEEALNRLPAREAAWLRGMAAHLLAMAPIQTTNDAAEDHHEEE